VLNGVADEFLEKISFQDVHVTFEGGGTAEEAIRDVPRLAGEYFEIGTPPAYGMYARNVRGLTLHNIRFELAARDLRPAILFDNVSDASVNGFGAHGDPQAEMMRLVNTRGVLVTAPRVLAPAAVFLKIEGTTSREITIDGGDLSQAGRALELGKGATASAVKQRI
jgi:hypothetical protein